MRAYFFCIFLESKIRVQVTERWGVEISTQYKEKNFLTLKAAKVEWDVWWGSKFQVI